MGSSASTSCSRRSAPACSQRAPASARASTLVSTAAAAQAATRGRARAAHHLEQPCSCHAVPASRQPAKEQSKSRSKFKRGLRFWKSWDTGLVKEGRRKKTTEQIMKMQARATRPLEGPSPTPLHVPLPEDCSHWGHQRAAHLPAHQRSRGMDGVPHDEGSDPARGRGTTVALMLRPHARVSWACGRHLRLA